MIELVGSERVDGRALYLAPIERLEDWPSQIAVPPANFVLFLALDATAVDDEKLGAFARRVLGQGAAYVCAWGPDCSRVHDVFDLAAPVTPEVPTTWHADDTLDEALWFALFAAWPDEPLAATTDAVLAVTVGREDWAEQLHRRFSDPAGLHADVALG